MTGPEEEPDRLERAQALNDWAHALTRTNNVLFVMAGLSMAYDYAQRARGPTLSTWVPIGLAWALMALRHGLYLRARYHLRQVRREWRSSTGGDL